MSKLSVFVVDDDDVVLRNITKKLLRLNCDVRAFGSGEALVEFLRNQEHFPDVFLLDFKMQGMNGIETLRAIRQFSPVPAIILTAYEGWVDLQEIKKSESCEVMLKTVDLHTLDPIVNGIMAVKKLQKTGWVDAESS